MQIEVKAQEDKPLEGKYFVILLQDGIPQWEEPISPFEDEKEKEFILRASAEIAQFNIEKAKEGSKESKRLITK